MLIYPVIALVVLLGVSVGTSPARAQTALKHDARTDRLAGLNKADLGLLEEYLAAGPVALVEFADDDQDELPAINLAATINAPAAKVAELIANPSGYPAYMPTIDKVKIVAKNGPSTVYDWGWTLAVFQLGGRNTMTVYPPPPGRPSIGYRMTIDSSDGDFGKGRFSVRVLEQDKKRSLLALSVRLDLRYSNYIVRQMARASRAVNRSANLAMAYSLLLSVRRQAELQTRQSAQIEKSHTLSKPSVDLKRLSPLLSRGDLILFDMTGDKLNQLTVLGQINYQPSVVRGVMTDADSFGAALVPGSYVRVVSRAPGAVDFDWKIGLPLIGASGAMKLKDDGSVISVDATSGALNGGQWRFETPAPTPMSTILVGWGSFDLKNSTWLLQNLVAADPYFEHGLMAAADIMLVRSVRSRAKKVTAAKTLAGP